MDDTVCNVKHPPSFVCFFISPKTSIIIHCCLFWGRGGGRRWHSAHTQLHKLWAAWKTVPITVNHSGTPTSTARCNSWKPATSNSENWTAAVNDKGRREQRQHFEFCHCRPSYIRLHAGHGQTQIRFSEQTFCSQMENRPPTSCSSDVCRKSEGRTRQLGRLGEPAPYQNTCWTIFIIIGSVWLESNYLAPWSPGTISSCSQVISQEPACVKSH